MNVSAVLILALISPLFALSPVPLLDREVRSLKSGLSPDSLWRFCQQIDRACGLEELEPNDLTGKPLVIEPADQKVRAALDAFIARAPKYRWKFYEYALNIEPKEISKGDPLDRKLKHVTLPGMSSTRAALSVLHSARLLGSFQPPADFRLRKLPRLEFKNMTVREALNKIASEDGHAMWTVSPTKKGGMLALSFGIWDDEYKIGPEYDMKGAESDEEMQRIRESLREWKVQ